MQTKGCLQQPACNQSNHNGRFSVAPSFQLISPSASEQPVKVGIGKHSFSVATGGCQMVNKCSLGLSPGGFS